MAKEPINRDLITRLLKEGATGKQRDIYDDQINGFGVLIMPRGKKPAFELVLEQIRCTYLSTDSPAVRVLKHERRVADQKTLDMPTVGSIPRC
jgi:hypothetical protein